MSPTQSTGLTMRALTGGETGVEAGLEAGWATHDIEVRRPEGRPGQAASTGLMATTRSHQVP